MGFNSGFKGLMEDICFTPSVHNTDHCIESRDKWAPWRHGMARPQVGDGRPPIWKIAANILNKQSRTADKGWSSSLGFGRGANNCSQ